MVPKRTLKFIFSKINEHTNMLSEDPQFIAFAPGEMKRFHFTCYIGEKYDDKDFFFIAKKFLRTILKT